MLNFCASFFPNFACSTLAHTVDSLSVLIPIKVCCDSYLLTLFLFSIKSLLYSYGPFISIVHRSLKISQIGSYPRGQQIILLCLGLRIFHILVSSLTPRPAAAISAEHSFFIGRGKTRLEAFTIAFQKYMVSPQREAVAFAVNGVDLTRSSLEEGADKWKMELLQVLVKITHDNLLGTQ